MFDLDGKHAPTRIHNDLLSSFHHQQQTPFRTSSEQHQNGKKKLYIH